MPRGDDRILWERFVMLRQGLEHGGASFDVGALLGLGADAWLPFLKRVAFAGEVEVALDLLRLSLEEARVHDPASRPLWRAWLQQHLAGHPDLPWLLDLI
jgi:hypothetical protein